MKVPDTINGFEVHKPLDALLEEPDPYFAPPPRLVATDIINDPILNALADNFQGIRDAEQLGVNQQQLNVAVSQAAVNQCVSQETLEKLLSRVSEQHGARARGDGARPHPREQRHAGLLFERPHVQAHRRLAQVQALGGAREASEARHRGEGAEMGGVELHGAPKYP